MTFGPIRLFLALLAAAAVLSTSSAAAQEPGVTYDPDSPAGNQYRLPLDSATSAGAPTKQPAPAAGAPAPAADPEEGLFGAGISAPEAEKNANGEAARGETTKSASTAPASAPPAEPETKTPARASAQPSAPDLSGTNASLVTGGVVVVLGLGAGILLRTTARRRDRAA